MVLSPLTQLGFAAIGLFLFMTILWTIQRLRSDAGVVDFGWAGSLGILAIFYAATMAEPTGRSAATALIAAAWSFRLASYILVNRVLGKDEDGRYQTLRRNWHPREQTFFFAFFQAQGLLALLFSLSFWIPIHFIQRPFGACDFVGIVIAAVAISGESLADKQLAAFRRRRESQGKTCRDGLWRYSRHPNYFFEWLHWWSYVLLAWGSPYWPATLVAPALMLFFLFKVTGIPATEAQALASRGDDYRDYQRTTNAFVPWFPKRGSA